MLDQATIDELKAKHGQGLELFETEIGDIVLKPPKEAEYRRFLDRVAEGDDSTSGAVIDFVEPHVVHPELSTFRQMRAEKPAIVTVLSNKLRRMAGSALVGEGKKL